MLRLFSPQSEVLLPRRDAAMADWPPRDGPALKDRDLEITSIADITVVSPTRGSHPRVGETTCLGLDRFIWE